MQKRVNRVPPALIVPVHWFRSFIRETKECSCGRIDAFELGDAFSQDAFGTNEVGASRFLRAPLMIIWLWLMVTDGFQGTSFLTQSDHGPIIKWAFLPDSQTEPSPRCVDKACSRIGRGGMQWLIVRNQESRMNDQGSRIKNQGSWIKDQGYGEVDAVINYWLSCSGTQTNSNWIISLQNQ